MKLPKVTKAGRAVHGKWYDDACGTAFGLELIGERWSLLVVRELMLGARRFSDLRSSMPGISAKVLTERLASLEGAGVLVKRRLAPPVSARVYELTPWGYAAEPLLQEIGRWAAMSSRHDPTLPLSPVSFMLSLRTMFDPCRAANLSARVGFGFPGASFVAELANGELHTWRGDTVDCDPIFEAPAASALAAVFYGDASAKTVGVSIKGDCTIAAAFSELFDLPQKIA